MRQIGKVTETDGEIVKVLIKRQSACGENCVGCGACQNRSYETKAKNRLGAVLGDTVVLEMDNKKVMGAAFFAYMLPLIVFFAAYGVSSCMGSEEIKSIFFGLLFMVLTYVVVHFKDKKLKGEYAPEIIEIKKGIE